MVKEAAEQRQIAAERSRSENEKSKKIGVGARDHELDDREAQSRQRATGASN